MISNTTIKSLDNLIQEKTEEARRLLTAKTVMVRGDDDVERVATDQERLELVRRTVGQAYTGLQKAIKEMDEGTPAPKQNAETPAPPAPRVRATRGRGRPRKEESEPVVVRANGKGRPVRA